MFFKGSRYEKVETSQITSADGRLVAYVKVRFTPETKAILTHLLSQGERLDHLSFRYYKDTERFWRICDANQVLWPDELLTEAGSRILIPPSA